MNYSWNKIKHCFSRMHINLTLWYNTSALIFEVYPCFTSFFDEKIINIDSKRNTSRYRSFSLSFVALTWSKLTHIFFNTYCTLCKVCSTLEIMVNVQSSEIVRLFEIVSKLCASS